MMNTKIIKLIADYLQECLQRQIHVGKLPAKLTMRLPMVITGAFDLLMVELFAKQVVFAIDHTETYSPAQLKKVANIVNEHLGMNCVFVFNQITGYNQTRMVKQGINFIVIDKMMYMPELLIDMRPIRIAYDQDTKMPATAQLIVLYHLECSAIIEMPIAEIAERMHVSYATCNKALTWLRGHNLAIETKVGKCKLISLETDKWGLWNNASKYMYSPIERVLYTDKTLDVRSGYNALATYSHLVRTDEQVFAWGDAVPDSFSKEENDVIVEIWRYHPQTLSNTGVVDPLSLYLILKDDDDERVSMELDYMLHQVLD